MYSPSPGRFSQGGHLRLGDSRWLGSRPRRTACRHPRPRRRSSRRLTSGPEPLLQCGLNLAPGLPGRLGVRDDHYPCAGLSLHRQSATLLLRPGRAFQLDQFITQFDCHGRTPVADSRHPEVSHDVATGWGQRWRRPHREQGAMGSSQDFPVSADATGTRPGRRGKARPGCGGRRCCGPRLAERPVPD